MRCLALAVLGACSFSPGMLPGSDAAGTGSDVRTIDAPDDTTMVDIDAQPDALNTGNTVRMIDLADAKITGGPHADFPVLVSITAAAWLRSKTNAGDVNRDDGFDIYFSADQLGATKLMHEVEAYDAVAGTLIAWVKVPVLMSTTVLYIHYGDTTITTSQENATAVWTAGFELVLHMDGGGDSTGKNDTNTGMMGISTGIGEARSFNGVDSYANVGSDVEVDNIFVTGGTVEAWFYANSFGESSRGRLFEKGDGGWQLFLDDQNLDDSISFAHTCSGGNQLGLWHGPASSITTMAWHHIALRFDKDAIGNDPTVILDGMPLALTESVAPNGNFVTDDLAPMYIGNNVNGSRTFDGTIDEARLSSVVRSDGWYATQYANHGDPATFYTVSAPL